MKVIMTLVFMLLLVPKAHSNNGTSLIPFFIQGNCETVFFEQISSDREFIQNNFNECIEDWVTIISTKPPVEYGRRIYYICGDIFECSNGGCYIGQDFCINIDDYKYR